MCFPETIDDKDVDAHQDAIYLRAVEVIRKTGRVSISHLQRQLGIGYAAANTIDLLEARGVVGPQTDASGQRAIFI
jgi:DNA segregation ATPase FtsK/SpoIIIE-like protein